MPSEHKKKTRVTTQTKACHKQRAAGKVGGKGEDTLHTEELK